MGTRMASDTDPTDSDISLALTRDAALVLFEWVVRTSQEGRVRFDDQAEQRVLWDLTAKLESALVEPFARDYTALVAAARNRIRDPDDAVLCGRVVVPTGEGQKPELFRTDEDIHSIFAIEGHWLVVCESSVRLCAGPIELARVELGDVVEQVVWNAPRLWVTDARGREGVLMVRGGRIDDETG
jgi:hypothetical protein